MATLKGAKNIIKNNVHKLAVCLYHKPENLYEIPLYLKLLVPEYKIKIRHHTYNIYDTVLYVSINKEAGYLYGIQRFCIKAYNNVFSGCAHH